MIKHIFYDLDGTLLPMDMDDFMSAYFRGICQKLVPHGYDPDALVKNIWAGTKAMVLNDGSKTNEDAFWNEFIDKMGPSSAKDKEIFEEFYRVEFNEVRKVVRPDERIPALIKTCKEMGLIQTLATNPLFPEIATRNRIEWAGLDVNDFTMFTTYENSHYCKPNTDYYVEVMEKVGAKPEETLMVGNDVDEDMIAEKLGMKVFLITGFMLNKHEKDINLFPHGDWDDLMEYIKKNIA